MASETRKASDSLKCEMDMTPMIDVVFNLVIFFMLATDLSQKDLVEMTLPLAHMAVPDKAEEKDRRIIVNLTSDGTLTFKGEKLSLEQLGTSIEGFKRMFSAIMRARNEDPEEEVAGGTAKASKAYVLLRADRNVPWQHVQWIMTVMAENKMYKLQFATKKYADKKYEELEKNKEENVKALGGISQQEYLEKYQNK